MSLVAEQHMVLACSWVCSKVYCVQIGCMYVFLQTVGASIAVVTSGIGAASLVFMDGC